MFDKLTDLITNYVEVKKEDIKPESRFMEDLGFKVPPCCTLSSDAQS